jgi:hypothetical protein
VSVVEAGRAAARRLMVDACTVTRVTGTATNSTTGVVTPTTSTVYTGPCRIKPDPTPSESQAGEREVVTRRFIVSVTTDEDGIAVDDIVTVTASELDPALVGVTLTVAGVIIGSHLTARRLVCVLTEN